jgi:uncharacterized protein YxjI
VRFLVKQRVFSVGDSYNIVNQDGVPEFVVVTSLVTFGHSLDMYDMANKVVATVQRISPSVRPTFRILRDGQHVADVHKDLFTAFHPHYTVRGPGGDFDIDGDWSEWKFTVTKDGQQVALVNKELSFVSDTYSVETIGDVDIPSLLCLVIVLDEVAHDA